MRIRGILAWLLTGLAIGGIGLYLWVRREELASIRIVDPAFLLLCAAGVLGNLFATGLLNFQMLRRLDCRVGFGEMMSLCVVSTTANLLIPARAGAGFRAIYLKRVHGLSYGRFLATLFGYFVLSMLICAVVGCLTLSILAMTGEYDGVVPVLTLASLAAAGCVGSIFLPQLKSERNWFLRQLSAVSGAWHRLREEPTFLGRSAAVALLQFFCFVTAFWGACLALGMRLGPLEVTAVAALGCLSTFVSITPGSLGFYEAVIAFTGASLGVSPVTSLAAALLWRVVLIAFLAVWTPLATRSLARRRRAAKAPEETRPITTSDPSS